MTIGLFVVFLCILQGGLHGSKDVRSLSELLLALPRIMIVHFGRLLPGLAALPLLLVNRPAAVRDA